MKIVETYSHLNGEEYLIARQPAIYDEIKKVIAAVDAATCKTKISKEKTMKGKRLFKPSAINKCFDAEFSKLNGWQSTKYSYCVTTDRSLMEKLIVLEFKEQKKYLQTTGIAKPLVSYKQTDFVKERVAVEVQFGKYAFVAFDLFVKHLMFYSGNVINVGVEVLPVKAMLTDPEGGRRMSTGIAYYEGEIYNIMRHGRSSPPVPLLIIGISD